MQSDYLVLANCGKLYRFIQKKSWLIANFCYLFARKFIQNSLMVEICIKFIQTLSLISVKLQIIVQKDDL